MFDTRSAQAAVETLTASVTAAAAGASGPVSAAQWVDLIGACRSLVNQVDAVSTITLAGEAESRTVHAIRLTGACAALLPVMTAGILDAWRARIVSTELADTDPTTAHHVARQIADRLQAGRLTTGGQVRAATRTLLAQADPTSVRTARHRARTDRALTRWACAPGQDQWTLVLPSEDALPAWRLVDATARELRANGAADTLDQARADALLHLLTRHTTAHYRVTLVTPATPDELAALDTLTAHGRRPAEPGESLVPVRIGRDDATVTSRWLDDVLAAPTTRATAQPVHPGTGALVPTREQVERDLDRRAYRPSTEQAAWVAARDGHCRFPGCTISPTFCDIDHTTPYDPDGGGATVRWNLMLLCRRHHRIKQLAGWAVRLHPDGTAHWRTPTGEHHTTAATDHSPRPTLADPAADTDAPNDPDCAGAPTPPRPPAPDPPPLSALEHHLTLAHAPDRRTARARREHRRTVHARALLRPLRPDLVLLDHRGYQLVVTPGAHGIPASPRHDDPPPF